MYIIDTIRIKLVVMLLSMFVSIALVPMFLIGSCCYLAKPRCLIAAFLASPDSLKMSSLLYIAIKRILQHSFYGGFWFGFAFFFKNINYDKLNALI